MAINSYPSFIPPRDTGDILYTRYPSMSHAGVLDYMAWSEKDTKPSGFYNPFYTTHIKDSFSEGRMRVNAASIELGVGKHISEVARYVNNYNLGTSDFPVGVSYFNSIGASGQVDWYNQTAGTIVTNTYVNNLLEVYNIESDRLEIISGHFYGSNAGVYFRNSTVNLHGYNLISEIKEYFDSWQFSYGHIYTSGNIKLFNDYFTIDYSGNMLWNIIPDTYINDNIEVNDLIFEGSGGPSGIIDSFRADGINEPSGITYDTVNGHAHEGSIWSNIEGSNFNLLCPAIIQDNYIYSLTKTNIVRIDTSIENDIMSWIPLDDLGPKADIDTRLDINGEKIGLFYNNGAIFSPSGNITFPKIPNPGKVRGFIINNEMFFFSDRVDLAQTTDGKTYGGMKWEGEFNAHRIGRYGYIVFLNSKTAVNMISYDGNSLKVVTSLPKGPIIASTIWKGEVIVLYENRILFRYNGKKARMIGIIPLDINVQIKEIYGRKSVIFVRYLQEGRYKVDSFGYNYDLMKLNQTPIFEVPFDSPLIVYENSIKLFIQMGSIRRWMKKDVSSALSFDSLRGTLTLTNGNINVKNNANFNDSIVRIDYPYLDAFDKNVKIGMEKYLLEPGRPKTMEEDTSYDYIKRGGTFAETWLDDYLYNKSFSKTYTDISCSTLYNNSIYLGHRGDATIFKFDSSHNLTMITSEMKNSIPVRFLPTTKTLFCQVQNFDDIIPEVGNMTIPSKRKTNHIPNVPLTWDAPVTKILQRNESNDSWDESPAIKGFYGTNIIDSIIHDDDLYILTQQGISGVACYRHSTSVDNLEVRVAVGISGYLNLNEKLQPYDTDVTEFVTDSLGNYVVDSNDNYLITSTGKKTGFHRFYLGEHPNLPYIIHHHVATLPKQYGPSGVLLQDDDTYFVDTENEAKYNYNIMDVYWAAEKNELSLDTPFARIIIDKDNNNLIDATNDNELSQAKLAEISRRKVINYVTSFVINKNIYIVVQTDDFNISVYKITSSNGLGFVTQDGDSTTIGEGSSHITDNISTIRNNLDFVPDFTSVASHRNHLHCRINIARFLGLSEKIKILGDGDDMFLVRLDRHDYRGYRRYSSTGYSVTNGIAYVPLMARTNDPYGKLYSCLLMIYGNDNIVLSGTENRQQLIYRPSSRAHFVDDGRSLIITEMKLDDKETDMKSYSDILSDDTLSILFGDINVRGLSNNERLGNIYNSFGKKKLIIGKRDYRTDDLLNARERY